VAFQSLSGFLATSTCPCVRPQRTPPRPCFNPCRAFWPLRPDVRDVGLEEFGVSIPVGLSGHFDVRVMLIGQHSLGSFNPCRAFWPLRRPCRGDPRRRGLRFNPCRAFWPLRQPSE